MQAAELNMRTSVDHDATHGLLIYNLYTTHVESYAYY